VRARLSLIGWALAALTAAAGIGEARAQGLNFGSGGDERPIEVFADEGIEWQQEKMIFLARGNARAIRGEVTVYGDELRAYYRKGPDGGTDIWRLDAIGHVRIVSPGETASGDHGIYDVEKAILILSGPKVRLLTATDEITATQQLEYWETRQMAVARGDAKVVARGQGKGRNLEADVLVAYLKKDAKGSSSVHRVEAFDNVRIDSEDGKATSDRGVYTVKTGIATLTGSVKIVREGNTLDGCRADVNMASGVSKLFGCEGQSGGQVGGVFTPSVRKQEDGSGAP